jgi:integrase
MTIYLGVWGSAESVENYGEMVTRIGNRTMDSPDPSPGLAFEDAALRYVEHKRVTMPESSGEPHAIDVALKDIAAAVGPVPASGITPAVLMKWRDAAIGRGLSMSTINKRTNYLLSFVRWLSVMGLARTEMWTALQAVERLKPGRSAAKPPKIVQPVEWEHVEKTLPFLSERMRDFVMVQSYTGARSGELVTMTLGQLDASYASYRPIFHKTAGRGHARVIPLGPKAREIVARRAEGLGPDDRIFGSIHVSSISHEVAKACLKAGVPKWTPHQLRHRAATIVLNRFGIAAARSLLGHASLAMTSRYAKPDLSEAQKAVEEIG